jgi:hypothetical protein
MSKANEAMQVLLGQFATARAGIDHRGASPLFRKAGPMNGPPAVTGMDIAHFKGGRIQALDVFPAPVSATESWLRTGAAMTSATSREGLTP